MDGQAYACLRQNDANRRRWRRRRPWSMDAFIEATLCFQTHRAHARSVLTPPQPAELGSLSLCRRDSTLHETAKTSVSGSVGSVDQDGFLHRGALRLRFEVIYKLRSTISFASTALGPYCRPALHSFCDPVRLGTPGAAEVFGSASTLLGDRGSTFQVDGLSNRSYHTALHADCVESCDPLLEECAMESLLTTHPNVEGVLCAPRHRLNRPCSRPVWSVVLPSHRPTRVRQAPMQQRPAPAAPTHHAPHRHALPLSLQRVSKVETRSVLDPPYPS